MVPTVCSMPLFLVRSYTISYSFSSLTEPWGGKGLRFPIFRRNKEHQQPGFGHATPWLPSAESPFVPPDAFWAASWSVAHLPHALGILTEDRGPWVVKVQEPPSLAREQLSRDPGEVGASQGSSSSHKLGKQFLLLRLALWRISGSAQALDLSVCLILHGEQRPFLQALHYPTQELMLLARLGTPCWLNGWTFHTTKYG